MGTGLGGVSKRTNGRGAVRPPGETQIGITWWESSWWARWAGFQPLPVIKRTTGTGEDKSSGRDPRKEGIGLMDKKPLVAIDRSPVDIWYEGPGFLVVEKPPGMAVHPDTPEGTGTLVNALFQSNRWLAEMETSIAPGVIHRFRPEDHGLILVAKSDDEAMALREAHASGQISFRYRVRMSSAASLQKTPMVSVVSAKTYGDLAVYDIKTTSGDTDTLRGSWIGDKDGDAEFVCYEIGLEEQDAGGYRRWATGQPVALPDLELYTAPP